MSGDAGQRFYRSDCCSVKQQTSELMGSWDPGGTGATGAMDHRNLESSMDARDFTSKDPCAVPIGLCHAVKGGATMSESMDLLSPDVRILCTNSGCDYGGPVHRSCLSRWSSCCELRCRMLASIPVSSTGQSVPQLPGLLTDATNAMLDGLLTLYRCPQCAQCTLCRMVLNPVGKPIPTPCDPHSNILGAMQYVSQQGMRSSLNSTLPPPPGLGTGQQGSEEVIPSNINVCPTSSDAGFPVLSDTAVSTTCPILNNPMGTFSGTSMTDEDQFGTDMPMDHRKRSSWHTIWSNSLASPGPLAQYHTNQQTQLMRRLSLRFTNSIGSNSSGSTSGFGSATFGSSFSAVGDTSIDSSRRSSRNACASDISDVFRPAVQSNVGHVTIADENFLSGWTATTDSGLSVIGAANSPRALLGSGSLLSATRHSMTGPGCGNVRAEFGQGLNNPLTVKRTNSPGSAGTNNTDVFEDTTQLPCEVGSATHVTPGSGRRHHSTSCVTAGKGGGPSFWPSDPDPGCKSRVCNNSDTQGRKVVSRKGNIFKPRQDFTVFQTLPVHKRNAYFIQMDDDSCTGNEDTRAFLLAQLTNHRISEVSCLACHQALIVYDHFPVVDGIFFISPICHRATSPCGRRSTSGLRVTWHTNGIPTGTQPSKLSGANADLEEVSQGYVHKLLGSGLMVVPPPGCLGPRQQIAGNHAGPDGNDTVQHHSHSHQYHYPYHQQHNSNTGRHGGGGRQERYLHALCMNCLHAGVPANSEDATIATERTEGIYCRSCLRPWSGATLLVGGLYTYDVLAAWPCCPDRLTCNTCGRHLVTTSDSTTANGRSEPAGNMEKENANVGQQFSLTYPFPFFSQYSQLITCPYCSKVDYHFVKQFDQQFRTDIGPQFRSGTG